MANKKAKPSRTGKAITRPANAGDVPVGYGALLEDLKTRIRAAQVKAALSVNRELIALYWHIGRSIVERQAAEGWGKAVVERLSDDLGREFPGVAGFSAGNIWRMRAFYLAWTEEVLAQAARENGKKAKLAQAARELDGPNPPEPVSDIPWFHNVVLVEKLKDPAVRLWYARQTVANGWSRAMLTHWVESDLHARQGKAVTNFKAALPAPQSDLAAEGWGKPPVSG
jgi:predicted nuclease of restriction endonuclease-like (RecB) superfamily